jgi:hypothetical protein
MKNKEAPTLLERMQKVVSENAKESKLDLNDFDIRYEPKDELFLIYDKNDNYIGRFPYSTPKIRVRDTEDFLGNQLYPLPNYITMDVPRLKPEYQGRGLGEQMYKHIEKVTGKTILPDDMLSSAGKALHEKKGLGKSFGKKEYGPSIIADLIKQIKESNIYTNISDDKAKALATEAFENFSSRVRKNLPEFKSIAPLIGKTALIGAGGALSLGAKAAEEIASTDELGNDVDDAKLIKERNVKGSDLPENLKEEMLKEYNPINISPIMLLKNKMLRR